MSLAVAVAVAVVGLLALASAVVSLALALLAASASAFFLASLTRRLYSASLLPEATRPGFLAGFVFGGSAVTRAGVGEFGGVGAGVSSGCEAIGYI